MRSNDIRYRTGQTRAAGQAGRSDPTRTPARPPKRPRSPGRSPLDVLEPAKPQDERRSIGEVLRRQQFSYHLIDDATYQSLLSTKYPADVSQKLAGRSVSLEQARGILSNSQWKRWNAGHGRHLVGTVFRHTAAPTHELRSLLDAVPESWATVAREVLAGLETLPEREALAGPGVKAVHDAYHAKRKETGQAPGMKLLREELFRSGLQFDSLQLLDLFELAARGVSLELTQQLWPFWQGHVSPEPLLTRAFDDHDALRQLFTQSVTAGELKELRRPEHRDRMARVLDRPASIAASVPDVLETFGKTQVTALQLYEVLSHLLIGSRLTALQELAPAWNGEGRAELLVPLFKAEEQTEAKALLGLLSTDTCP